MESMRNKLKIYEQKLTEMERIKSTNQEIKNENTQLFEAKAILQVTLFRVEVLECEYKRCMSTGGGDGPHDQDTEDVFFAERKRDVQS